MDCTFLEFCQVWVMMQRLGKPPHRLPKMHQQIAVWLDESRMHSHRLLMAYRYSGKSYLIGLYVAWRLALDPNWTFLVVSAGRDLAHQNTSFMRQVIEHHPFCSHLLSDDNQWQRASFTVKRPTISNIPSVSCRSMLGKLTGFHGHECILDDSETHDNATTEENRRKIRTNLEELNTTVDRILAVGTPHHEDSIYRAMMGLSYHHLLLGFYDEEGKPRNPEMGHDEAWLDKKRLNTSKAKIDSQYFLKFTKGYDGQYSGEALIQFRGRVELGEPDDFDEDDLRLPRPSYCLVPERGEATRIKDLRAYYDPAFGTRNRDNAVLAVVAKDEAGNVYVVACEVLPEMLIGGENPAAPQLEMILQICKSTKCNLVYVEKNFSPTLAAELKRYARNRSAKLMIRESVRSSRQHKIEFIADTIEPLMTTGRLHVHADCIAEFRLELEDFPRGRHDDRLDAVAGAIHELIPTRIRAGEIRDDDLFNPHGFRRSGEVHVINQYEPSGI